MDGLLLGDASLIGTPFADVTHARWLPPAFFDGRGDVAFKELYYNGRLVWGADGDPFYFDIQTVAIHESGHAFGLGHFGKVSPSAQRGGQFAPKAIMNPVYLGEDRRIYGTDYGSFCQIWANGR